VWIVVSFKINQVYIAKNLCVQRNIKNNHCHGYCQLKKQLAENDKQEQKQLPRSATAKIFFSVFVCNELSSYNFRSAIKDYSFNNYLCFFPNSIKCAIFHPPKKASHLPMI
jgi:hypothetical protein